MPAVAVVGMQWGDEGKGKIVDLLAQDALHIARAQGGNNAGHTVVAAGKEYRFHLIPSGILYPHAHCYIGGGVVVDPASFLAEVDGLRAQGIDPAGRLFLSPYAHLIFPWHRLLDELSEAAKGVHAVGTTGRGIGPCYEDKAARRGLRVADLLSQAHFPAKLERVLSQKNRELDRLYGRSPLELAPLLEEYAAHAGRIAPFVAPVEEILFKALRNGHKVLFEGAQGALLDITFGTYPFVTSSCTLAGGIPAGLGVGPQTVGRILGVTKAYTTRVGQGPFPTELSPEEMRGFPDHTSSREIGVTTGRKRRIGWFDAPLIGHTAHLNGVDSLAVTKIDILDGLDEIKICKGYRLDDAELSSFPVVWEDLSRVEPVYETREGWKTSTRNAKVFQDLPAPARAYLRRLEELTGVEIGVVSVGPAREQTLWLDRFFEGEE